MKNHRTARGKTINMQALAAQYESERAVSNVPINGRGDIIDGKNRVVVKREQVKKEYYSSPPKESVEVSLKQDPTPEPSAEEPVVEPVEENISQSMDGEVEISRNKITRPDGSQYWEIEYSDGSMMDVDIN